MFVTTSKIRQLYSGNDAKYQYGLNVVFVIWTDDNTCFPIGFRLWKKDDMKSRLDLVIEILKEAKKTLRIKPVYVLMDSFYIIANLLRCIHKLKWHSKAKLKPNRLIEKFASDTFSLTNKKILSEN